MSSDGLSMGRGPSPDRLRAAIRLQQFHGFVALLTGAIHFGVQAPLLGLILVLSAALSWGNLPWAQRAPESFLRGTALQTLMIPALVVGLSGGVRAPHVGWWVLGLVVAAVIHGRSFSKAVFAAAGALCVLAGMQLWGWEPPYLVPANHRPWVETVSVGLQAMAAALFAFMYLSSVNAARLKSRRITERLASEVREREEAQARLEAADRWKSTFLATVSHELRTPLNGVLGMTQLLRHSGMSEEQERFVGIAEQSGRTLLELLNELLDFTKLEAGALQLEARVFAPLPILEEVAVPLGAQAIQKNVRLYLIVDPECPREVRGDPLRFRQIVLNILNNAVKFTESGHVVLRLTEGEQGGLLVSVEDTGIGMDGEAVERLFEPFMQAEASTSRRFGGTGLGLTIAQRLCQAMGGAIQVRSTPGVGSRFAVTLPLQAELAGPPPATARRVAALMFDDPLLRESIGPWLEQWGYTLTDQRTDAVHAAFVLATASEWKTDDALPNDTVRLLDVSQSAQRQGVLAMPLRLAELRTSLGLSPLDRESTPVEFPLRFPIRALVVDDQAINRTVTRRMLESTLGLSVDTVSGGEQALRQLREESYEIVFMDCQMPEMDGFEATERIRRELDPARQPFIVALTASSMADSESRAQRAGMNAHLNKPLDLGELRNLLSELFEPSSPAANG